MAEPRRFVVSPEAIVGGRVRFDRAETRHLARVLRLGPGAVVEVLDGTGRRLRVRLDAVGQEAVGTVLGTSVATGESPCAITLAQAILKGDRMSWLVQKATELGVARLVPIESARVVARPPGERVDGRVARWTRVAREAVKQCERTRVPTVERPRPLAAVLAEAADHDAAWLCWERGGVPLAAAARAAGRVGRLLLLVGPEGGFTDEEVARARARDVALVSLGPRILRAESAALVAVVLCQHLFGDLGTGPEATPSPPVGGGLVDGECAAAGAQVG